MYRLQQLLPAWHFKVMLTNTCFTMPLVLALKQIRINTIFQILLSETFNTASAPAFWISTNTQRQKHRAAWRDVNLKVVGAVTLKCPQNMPSEVNLDTKAE